MKEFKDGFRAYINECEFECNLMKMDCESHYFVKSGGEWISSVDVENAVATLEAVNMCACVGVRHKKWDERPIIVATVKEGTELSLEDVRVAAIKKVSIFEAPDDLLIWKELPIGGNGKVARHQIRAKLNKEKYVHPDDRE